MLERPIPERINALRVKDIAFDWRQLIVRAGKGDKDRITMLPASAVSELEAQLQIAKALHQCDLAQGNGRAPLPYALASFRHANASLTAVSACPERSRIAGSSAGIFTVRLMH